jgi:tRNA(Ile)-lysidine synthase
MPSLLRDSVKAFLVKHEVTECSVVLGISGGLDSMTLWQIMSDLAEELSLTLVVAHAHHGLRGIDADDDQRFVVSLADERGQECITDRLDVQAYHADKGVGLEAAARTLRYAFLEQAASRSQARFIAVAHSADDVAETFLMNAGRGSGLDGLSSHKAVRAVGSHILIRPLLRESRRSIEDHAREHGVQWREDDTNADLHFLRNRVRHLVMPVMREIFGTDVGIRMARSAELLHGAHTIVNDVLARTINDVLSLDGESVDINVAELRIHQAALQTEFIRAALRTIRGEAGSHSDTERILELVSAAKGSKATLAGGIQAIRERDAIVLVKTQDDEVHPEVVITADGLYVAGSQRLAVSTTARDDVRIDPDRSTAYIDADCVKGALRWRPWTDGDRLTPFGMEGSMLVSDLLTNEHVPHGERRLVRVLTDDEGILWVCGLRPSERTRVTSTTSSVVTVTIGSEQVMNV